MAFAVHLPHALYGVGEVVCGVGVVGVGVGEWKQGLHLTSTENLDRLSKTIIQCTVKHFVLARLGWVSQT